MEDVGKLACMMGCRVALLTIKYLGLPLGAPRAVIKPTRAEFITELNNMFKICFIYFSNELVLVHELLN